MYRSRTRAAVIGWLALIGVAIGGGQAFADSPPSVWEFSGVFTIGAAVDGGSIPTFYYDTFHRFAFQRDEDTTYTIWESAADGLGRHNFSVAVTRAEKPHGWVTGQTCWHELYAPWVTSCGPWSEWRSVYALDRPGAAGELRGLGNKCVEAAGVTPVPGAPIQYWDCWGGNNQKWSYTATHDLASWAGRCMTALGPWNGNGVAFNDCIDWLTQRWNFVNAQIRGLDAKCFDAPFGNTDNGTQAQVWDCNGTGAQVFNFVDWSREIRGPNGKCLDAYAFGTANGTPVVFWDCNGLDNQKWFVGQNGEIRGWGNKCLEVAGFGIGNGTKLQTWDCHGGTNQKFWITGQLQGYGGACLDLPGGNTTNGTPMQMWQCLANDAFQVFTYTP